MGYVTARNDGCRFDVFGFQSSFACSFDAAMEIGRN
jgi:hypothetical protein